MQNSIISITYETEFGGIGNMLIYSSALPRIKKKLKRVLYPSKKKVQISIEEMKIVNL